MKLEPKSKFLVIGDSITDFGRLRPIGEGYFNGLGQSYISIVDSLMRIEHPEWAIRFVNMANGGDNSYDLLNRWQSDVLDIKPDYLMIQIGINDVWCHWHSPYDDTRFTTTETYRENLRKMVALTRDIVKDFFFLSPYMIEPCLEVPMRREMDEYRQVMKEVAEECGGTFIDIQEEFDEYCRHFDPMSINWDRIHPNGTGHLLIARKVAKTLEII